MVRITARMEADRLLFGGRWFPVTTSLTFFAAEAQDWVAWLTGDGDGWGGRAAGLFEVRPVTGSFEQLLGSLLPLESRRDGRLLVVPVDSDGPYRTALFGNWWVGSDLGSYEVWAAREGIGSVQIRSCPDNTRGQVWPVQVHGIHDFGMIRPAPPGTDPDQWEGRLVGIRWGSDGWEFGEQGFPALPFEDTARYLADRDRDKFPQQLLVDYAAALGIRCFDPDFYAPDRTATLLQLRRPTTAGAKLFTLAEVQSGRRWDDIGIPDPTAR